MGETRKKAESMLAEMAKFLDTMEKDENSKAEKEKSKKRKKEEKKENNEPNQWGYMNPETYVTKPKQVKGLGMLESKSSDSDSDAESETETRKKAESMLAEMAKFLDTMEKDENSKAEKEKSK